MLMPSIFGENLFDDFFGDFPFYDDRDMRNVEKKLYGKRAGRVMKTDIKETDKGYELEIDLPGFSKDEIKASLENGYLTISAEKGLDKEEKEKEVLLKENEKVSCDLQLETQLQAPVEKGQKIGKVTFSLGEQVLDDYFVTADRNIVKITYLWCANKVFHDFFH